LDSTKQLTPVLQRSVSEESASSTASVGVEAKTRSVGMEAGAESGNGVQSARGAGLGRAAGALKCWQQQPVLTLMA